MHKAKDHTAEQRKLDVLNQISEIINKGELPENAFTEICRAIPLAYENPEQISVRIEYNDKKYTNPGFKESQWLERQSIETPGSLKGLLEIFFSKECIESSEKGFLLRNSAFVQNVRVLLAGYISSIQLEILIYDNTERLKELKGISLTTEILERGTTLDESLQEICAFLPEAWQYPKYTAARIIYEDKIFESNNFSKTEWMQSQTFETPDNKIGTIEIYYLKEFPEADEGPFLKEERHLLDNLAAIISGTASKNALQELLKQNTERLKELKGINQTSLILKQSTTIEESLEEICAFLPEAWQYPEFTAVRISFEKHIFISAGFKETKWIQKQSFETPDHRKGLIEIFYTKEFPIEDEGPFLKEERDLLINLTNLIAGSATQNIFNKLQSENNERLKELKAINLTSQIIAEGRPVDETLQKICSILPKSWQYPKFTCVRITYEGKEYKTKTFCESVWVQKENFVTIDNKKGTIEVYYMKEFPKLYEGPFLKEERHLLINIGKLISGYLNDFKGRDIYQKSILKEKQVHKPDEYRKSLVKTTRPLQLFFNQQIIDKYIYLDMMKYKVKEILFVATLYDAFILENEDSFFEQFMGEIYQYSLFSLPRITGVSSPEEALSVLETTHFDLVILMVGMDRETPLMLSKEIKQKVPSLPIYLLLNQKNNIQYFEDLVPRVKSIDKLFIWNSDSQIFFAIVKSIEDKANVDTDTKIGLVRIILLVEDSALYYSKYLQMLYSIVFGQIQQLLPEVEKNELDKISKMRSRPKILHARNYEDAVYIFNKYKDFMLCVISDVEFEKEGKLDKTAGIKFIKYIKSHVLNLPVILQSSETRNEKLAKSLNIHFLNKNSVSLLNDLKKFLNYYLGFGDFIFRDKEGNKLAVAKTLREFETILAHIPDDSFYLHAVENQFSIWLMARGEIQLARILNPMRVGDFNNVVESRKFFIQTINKYREEKKRGRILSFEETSIIDDKNIVTFSGGSFGGKGRGLAFINTLINNLDFSEFSARINIQSPKTVIIGTDEFDNFIEKNKLFEKIMQKDTVYEEIKSVFVESSLSENLISRLKVFIDQIDKPVAVRSSSLSEDSLTQPFAGVFDTYIIPFSSSQEYMLKKLTEAIKLVYSSIYSDNAKAYYQAIHHKVEEEKMAVVLQELVGNQYGDYYYPHISGVAQSYNYYPIAHMKPEEGFAVSAVGLGSYVVEGWKSYRFSPKYPKVEIYTTKDLMNSTQRQFYAVDTSRKDIDFLKGGELAALALLDIEEAEKHGTLKHCASVYNADNDRLEPGLAAQGPRVINFANILKYDYIPLATTIDVMLNTIKDAIGVPIEIEYAVDLNKSENNLPTFYLLQIKPLVGNQLSYNIDFGKLEKSRMIMLTKSSLGNGELNYIRDILFVDIDTFDKLRTKEIAQEVNMLNRKLVSQNKQYILIGPGRWGTRDQFLGIPVNWSQISNAKVIVEISLADFPLDSSLGSHFFHNVTSMNIGYSSVINPSATDFIKWDILNEQKVIHKTNFVKHIRFENPLTVLMNGQQKMCAILQNT